MLRARLVSSCRWWSFGSFFFFIIIHLGERTCHGSSNIEYYDPDQEDPDLGKSNFGVAGDVNCPCITDPDEFPLDPQDDLVAIAASMAPQFNTSTYGLGCGIHDVDTYSCTSVECYDIFPRPASTCDKSWCRRAWCYIDPTNCTLLKRRSFVYPSSIRYYSYAACGQMDYFTRGNRISSLEGKTLEVGFNTNTGGWQGAYSNDRVQFLPPIEKWSGPTVEYVKQAAYNGGFTLKITEPPAFLRNRSNQFFDSESSFDFCVYAVALGYLDLCVAQYTITDLRASTTDFYILDSASAFLITETTQDGGSTWDLFRRSAWKAFAPFAVSTWLFIILFVIPIFSLLIVVHEYGQRGSTFAAEEKVIVTNPYTKTQEMHLRPVPIWTALFASLYQMLQSVFLWAWTQPVVTAGAKLNLIGISFFTLTTLVAYTANLAAIFGQSDEDAIIQGLEQAIEQGFRFCCERKNMITITSNNELLRPELFVVDPPELGGDGRPGFACADCSPRARVFEMVDPILAETDERYCHAAIAPLEDLEVLQADGLFCNLVSIGDSLQEVSSGLPLSEQIAPALQSFFLRLKNEGVSDEQVMLARPASICPVTESGEGTPLTIASLSGIWIVTFMFVVSGLLIGFVIPRILRWVHPDYGRREVLRKQMERPVIKRDQNGIECEVFQGSDDRELLALSLEQLSLHDHKVRNEVNALKRVSSHRNFGAKMLARSSDLGLESFDDGNSFCEDSSHELRGGRRPVRQSNDRSNGEEPFGQGTGLSDFEQEKAPESALQLSRPSVDSSEEPFSAEYADFEQRLLQRLTPMSEDPE